MNAWKCVKGKLPGSHSGQLHGFAVAAVSPTRFLIHGGTPGTADIALGFAEVARGNANYVTVAEASA